MHFYYQVHHGLSDDDINKFTAFFKNNIIDKPRSFYAIGEVKVDHWFHPVKVWKIEAEDLALSSKEYKAAMTLVDNYCGLCVSGPKFLKELPHHPRKATNAHEVASFYRTQMS